MTINKNDLIFKVGISLFVAVILFSITGCGEKLNKELKKSAKAIPDLISTAEKTIDENRAEFEKAAKNKSFAPIAGIANKENWNNSFSEAKADLSQLKNQYNRKLLPLIKKNKPESATEVRKTTTAIKKGIYLAIEKSKYPISRYGEISETISNAGSYNQKAGENAAQIQKIVNGLKTGVIAKALKDFPKNIEKINTRFQKAMLLSENSASYLNSVNAEFSKHTENKKADYAAFNDSARALSNDVKKAQTLEKELTEEIKQLYTSYTKILRDMKEELYVTIRRESWDENSDYYKPGFASFTRLVSPETYNQLTSGKIETIASINYGSRFTNYVGQAWNELKIDPRAQWKSSYHNAAVFWVEDSSEKYFHKYLLENDAQTTETEWMKVSEDVYETNFDNLGMAILSKPFGTFESDALTQAAPPGMAYVGNPQYGEWREDENGERFWSWYGRYRLFSDLLFFPAYYYYYNSWYGWHNSYRYKKPYYGKTKNGFQKFGTYGTYVKKSPKFQKTHFAQSGGFKSQTASVRGAGSGLRGGGPKGKGK